MNESSVEAERLTASPKALACPRCHATTALSETLARCPACQLSFILRSGPLIDANKTARPVALTEKPLKLKAPGALVRQAVMIKPEGIAIGTLDPIVGAFAAQGAELKYAYIATVSAHRQIDTWQLVLCAVLSGPLALFGLAGSVSALVSHSTPAVLCTLPLVALGAFHGYRTFIVRSLRLRVVGIRDRTIEATFLGGKAAQARFLDTLLERIGSTAAAELL